MDRPSLNDDILLHIMSFADKQTILYLLQTSKMFHYHGARYLLKGDVAINVVRESQIMSFKQFFLCDLRDMNRPSRLPFLRSLRLTRLGTLRDHDLCSRPSITAEASLKHLFVMLARAGNLVKLDLRGAEDILATYYPCLIVAIAELQTLKDLSIFQVGEHSARMLTALRSSLVRAGIVMGNYSDESPSSGALERDPTHLLYHSRSSLQQLRLVYAEIHPSSLCFPNVRHLDIETRTIQSCQMQHYVRVFPNLRDFCMNYWHYRWDEDGIEPFDMHRASNLSVQRRLGSWPSLENYRGTIGLLYSIGIPCHIRVLDLADSAGWLGCTYGPRVLDAVLECARPHLLRLSMWDGAWFGTSHFLETFSRRKYVGALEFLGFELDLFREDPASRELPAALNTAIPAAVALLNSLTAFTLRINCEDIPEFPTESEGGRCPLEEALNEWDITTFAQSVHAAGPTLASVSVAMSGHYVRRDESVQIGPVYQFDEMRFEWVY